MGSFSRRVLFVSLLCVGCIEQSDPPDDVPVSLPQPIAAADPLQNGFPVGNLSGARGNERHFFIEVPAGRTALSFVLSGGSGDADLYVRFGSQPTVSQWDHRPYLEGNDERVEQTSPTAGTWHVMVRAYRAYSGATLHAIFVPAAVDGGSDSGTDAGQPDAGAVDAGVEDAGANPAFEVEVLSLVNQRRQAGATCGSTAYLPAAPLSMNPRLRVAARLHSEDMAAQNYFSHTSLDGRTFAQRIAQAGYAGASPWGENIAAGHSSPQAVVNAWMSSPGHCSNIMSPGYRAIGVGYGFRTNSSYRHYWTQDFGASP